MANDNQIIVASQAAGGAQGGAFDVYGETRRAIRGRRWLVALLAIIGVAVGGYGAWRFVKPMYRSEGLVRIACEMPSVMQETDQNKPLAMFDTFVQSQKMLISSRRVLDSAMQDPLWRAGNRQLPDPASIAGSLTVEGKPRSEYLQISVDHADPQVAAMAVTTIINAYAELYNNQDKQLERQRIGVLEDRQTSLKSKIDQLRTQMRAIALEFGTEKLDTVFDAVQDRVVKLETAMGETRAALALTPQPATQPSTQPAKGEDPKVTESANTMTPEQIAMVDPQMRSYCEEQRRLEDTLDHLAARGLGEAHRDVKTAKQALEKLMGRITRYAEEYRAVHPTIGPTIGPGGGHETSTLVGAAGQSRAALQAREASLLELHKTVKAEMLALGGKRLEMIRLDTELRGILADQEKLSHRIDVLRAEGSLGGRLSVISTGEVPLAPLKNPMIKIAGAAAVGGFGLPGMVIAMLMLGGRKYRYSDEAVKTSQVQLLGILPKLNGNSKDLEEMDAVAHCIHQIRVTLCARSPQKDCRAYLITSAASGEGKTGLTMALGLSFAMSNRRTVVVDCDWLGRGLSQRLGAEEEEGVYEASQSGNVRPLLRKSIGGMYFLPTGHVDPAAASAISGASIRRVFDELRKEFEVILVDTGPVLGSVEATVLAQEVDEVILAVARGQQRSLVERTVDRLRSLGVTVSGFVFNLAQGRDFHHSVYGSSSRSASINSRSTATRRQPDPKAFMELGPLARVVAVQCSTKEEAGGVEVIDVE